MGLNFFKRFTRKCLEPGLHIRQVKSGPDIRPKRYQLVSQVMGKIQTSSRMSVYKPRAVNDIGIALGDRLEHQRVVRGRIFKIGILNYYHIACSRLETSPDRGALAPVLLKKNNLVALPERGQNFF